MGNGRSRAVCRFDMIARGRIGTLDKSDVAAPVLSDGEGAARFFLTKGYRAAKETVAAQLKLSSDKETRAQWLDTNAWIEILSDHGTVGKK